MENVDIMPDASEVVHYDEPGIGLYIRSGKLSAYPGMRATCHWHEDLEFIHVLEGEMNYSVSGQTVLLAEGDCLFVNARQLHFGFGHRGQECVFTCILVHPDMLTGSRKLFERYVRPLITAENMPYLQVLHGEEGHGEFARCLSEVRRLKDEAPPGYELTAMAQLSGLMAFLLHHVPQKETCSYTDQKLEIQKRMVAYIAKHYAEPITLDEIAASANLSKSSCIRLFKTYVDQSPFDFLIAYRLHVACDLLARTENSVTEIAALCGFNYVSYFTKVFRLMYGCTPSRYRKNQSA